MPIASADCQCLLLLPIPAEYGCCYWNAIKRRVPKNDYVDEDNLKYAIWEAIGDAAHMEEELYRLKPPTKKAEEI